MLKIKEDKMQEIGGKENKEFYEDARKVAESCSKERLVELYLAEVQTCCEVEEYKEIADNTIERYAEKCKVLEKALELACERVKYFEEIQDKEMGYFELFGYDNEYDLQAIIERYKQQAKEMLENE